MWTAPCLRATTTILPFIKNKKKYASVKVNMQTGDAVETRTKDGATANFNVFV